MVGPGAACFTVDPDRGLDGTSDFLLSRSPEQLIVLAPVLAIVEAKADNIKSGLGQCVAAMVAAQVFNARAGNGISVVHGVVTTGSVWKFLRLEGQTVTVDQAECYLDRLGKVLGVLLTILGQEGPTTS